MYPLHLASLFPSFPSEDKVFVAMSFDDRFQKRWEDVIRPAISDVPYGSTLLQPYRVDTNVVSDSIVKEIIKGITTHRLVFADITTIGSLKRNPQRNANVMYEIGLAHVLRQPDDVVLFRSDRARLPFDIANVRVNSYNPDDDPVGARNAVKIAITEAIRASDFRRSIAVQTAVQSLSHAALAVLLNNEHTVSHPSPRTMGEVMVARPVENAIDSLLELGILKTKYPTDESQDLELWRQLLKQDGWLYEVTEFGIAVRSALIERIGLADLVS